MDTLAIHDSVPPVEPAKPDRSVRLVYTPSDQPYVGPWDILLVQGDSLIGIQNEFGRKERQSIALTQGQLERIWRLADSVKAHPIDSSIVYPTDSWHLRVEVNERPMWDDHYPVAPPDVEPLVAYLYRLAPIHFPKGGYGG